MKKGNDKIMTIGLWVTAIVIGIVGLIISTAVGYFEDSWTKCVVGIIITVLLTGAVIGIGHWYCNSTASGVRAMKDQQSNLDNGLHREIIITAEDGREIFYYEGKCDIETDHSSYILFEDEEGYRHIIYKGVQDTIIINEIP